MLCYSTSSSSQIAYNVSASVTNVVPTTGNKPASSYAQPSNVLPVLTGSSTSSIYLEKGRLTFAETTTSSVSSSMLPPFKSKVRLTTPPSYPSSE